MPRTSSLPLVGKRVRYPSHEVQVIERKGNWRWKLTAINTEDLITSNPFYNTRRAALHNLADVTGISVLKITKPARGGFRMRIRLFGVRCIV